MKRKLLLVTFIFLPWFNAVTQTDWTHSKVFQLNLTNKFISKTGNIMFYGTNNSYLKRATYYEYFNNKIQASTNYNLNENGRDLYFIFRAEPKSDSYAQITIMPSSDTPSYSSFKIAHNQKKEITDHGLVYTLYRYGDFIELLQIKTIRGKVTMSN